MDKRRGIRRFDKIPVSFSLEADDAEFLKAMPNRSEWLQKKVAEEKVASGLAVGQQIDTQAVEETAQAYVKELYDDKYAHFGEEAEADARSMGLYLWRLTGEGEKRITDDPLLLKAVFYRVHDLLTQAYRKRWKRSPPAEWDESIMGFDLNAEGKICRQRIGTTFP